MGGRGGGRVGVVVAGVPAPLFGRHSAGKHEAMHPAAPRRALVFAPMQCRSFEADDPDGANAFVDVALAARATDPRWIASPRASTLKQLGAGHPLWKQVQRRFFVIDGRARCAALINPRLLDGDRPWGQAGFFEAVDDDAGRVVLDAAMAWLGERGCKRALGPMNGSTWHSYRFVVDWKDATPLLLEPNNPLRYPALWESHGWKRHDVAYYSSAHDNAAVVDALQKKHEAVVSAGYRMEAVDLKDVQAVLKTMFELSRRIFSGNAFYSDLSFEEFAANNEGVERVLDQRLVQWLRGPADDVVGFAFGLPDHAVAATRMRGDTGLLGKLRFVTAPRPKRNLVKTIGVVPEHRGKGLLSEIYFTQARAALDMGFSDGVVVLMSADNRSFTGTARAQSVIREYALYVSEVA